MPRKIPPGLQAQVRHRAKYLCEYCHTSEQWQYVRFTINHLMAESKGGLTILANLVLACFHCNRRKSDKLTFVDKQTGQDIPLFNPRQDVWADHFIWSADGLRIIPLTAIGRVTVDLLDLNRERALRIRAADVSVNRHPPTDDPLQQSDYF